MSWAGESITESAQRDCEQSSSSSTIGSPDKFSPQLLMSWTRQQLSVDPRQGRRTEPTPDATDFQRTAAWLRTQSDLARDADTAGQLIRLADEYDFLAAASAALAERR
jgi:hypothetical protein